jgi:hypothetical protein
MKKLRLDVDALQVETFKTKDGSPATGGSVVAYQESRYDCPPTERCSEIQGQTCVNTCGFVETCWLSC